MEIAPRVDCIYIASDGLHCSFYVQPPKKHSLGPEPGPVVVRVGGHRTYCHVFTHVAYASVPM